jgi:hypothetical protein
MRCCTLDSVDFCCHRHDLLRRLPTRLTERARTCMYARTVSLHVSYLLETYERRSNRTKSTYRCRTSQSAVSSRFQSRWVHSGLIPDLILKSVILGFWMSNIAPTSKNKQLRGEQHHNVTCFLSLQPHSLSSTPSRRQQRRKSLKGLHLVI